MGRIFSPDTHPVIKVWIWFLEKYEIEYKKEPLFNLILWTKENGVETTKETALDIDYWTKFGKEILNAA